MSSSAVTSFSLPTFGVICTVLVFGVAPPVIAQDSDDTSSNPYQPKQLTLPDGERLVRVQASFHLLSVHGIDDEAETFKFSGILTLSWISTDTPLDEQRLKAEFEVLGFNDEEVVLEAGPDAAMADLAEIQVPQWDLTGLDATILSRRSPYAGSEAQSFVFALNLETDRQAFFMIRLVIIPLIFIVGLSFSVFWMDRSSLGDRMATTIIIVFVWF